MRNAALLFANYSHYQRSTLGLILHVTGMLVGVFGLISLLSRPEFAFNGYMISPAIAALPFITWHYIKIQINLALIMAGYVIVNILLAQQAAHLSTSSWLILSLIIVSVGALVMIAGHRIDQSRAPFLDDAANIMFGPLFALTKTMMALGMFSQLNEDVNLVLDEQSKT